MKRESFWVGTRWGGAQGIRAQVESGEQTHGVGVAGLTQYQPTWGEEGIHMACQLEWGEVSLPLTGVDHCAEIGVTVGMGEWYIDTLMYNVMVHYIQVH